MPPFLCFSMSLPPFLSIFPFSPFPPSVCPFFLLPSLLSLSLRSSLCLSSYLSVYFSFYPCASVCICLHLCILVFPRVCPSLFPISPFSCSLRPFLFHYSSLPLLSPFFAPFFPFLSTPYLSLSLSSRFPRSLAPSFLLFSSLVFLFIYARATLNSHTHSPSLSL